MSGLGWSVWWVLLCVVFSFEILSYLRHFILFRRLSENELYLIYYLNTFIYHYLIIVFRQDFDQLYIIKYVDMNIPTRFISLLREVKNLSPGSICPGLLRRWP